MNQSIKITVLLFTILLILSCEKEIELVNPDESRKPVVYAELQEDSIIKIDFYQSNLPLTSDSSFDLITDAEIIVKNENSFNETLAFRGGNNKIYGVSEGFYYSSSSIQDLGEFSLNIKHKDFDEITATATFPPKASVDNISFKQKDFEYNLGFDILDNGSTKDYYDVNLIYEFYTHNYIFDEITFEVDTIIDGPFISSAFLYKNDGQTPSEFSFRDPETGTFFNDALFNGSSYHLDYIVYLDVYIDTEGGFYENEITKAYLEIETLNKSLYDYKKSVDEQNRANNDPFAEPVIIRSNVENAIGVFGAKTRSRFEVDL